MIYPCAIVGVAVLVVAVLMIFVIPVFAELYGSMGKALPAPTQICINISNWFVAYWYLLIAAGVGVTMAISAYYKTPPGRMQIDGLLLRMPIIGDLLRKVAVARFSQNDVIPACRSWTDWRSPVERRAIKSSRKRLWRAE
jgi:type IV pilus assembly protein PilC